MPFPKLEKLLEYPLYGLDSTSKHPVLLAALKEVSRHHYDHCGPYAKLCQKRGVDIDSIEDLPQIPYLPTSLFKQHLLLSIAEDEVFREVQSSATTSGMPSRMGLDKANNLRQNKCFSKTIMDRIGNKRFNFIVLDEPSSIGRSKTVSARSSTMRSLLFCAKDAQTCLVEDGGQLSLDEKRLEALLDEHQNNSEELIIFGFTFILYAYVVRRLLNAGKKYALSGAKVIHIGGWKKLESQKVSQQMLIDDCCKCFGVHAQDVVDLYGFTEQGGMIYPTCEQGRRHAPVWSEVIVRDPVSLNPLGPGKEGLMQFLTPIQTSYPGHSVLTEDIGRIIEIDDCPCGRKGTTFQITGRAREAEVRGCGDIMADKFA